MATEAEFIGVLPVYKNAEGQICIGFAEEFADGNVDLEESVRKYTRDYKAEILKEK